MVRQTGRAADVGLADDGEFRGLDFGVDLDPGDKAYGTMSLMTRAERVTKKPEWVRSFVGTGAELFWRDFAADGLLDEADEAPVEEVMDGRLPAQTTGSLGIVADLAPGETRDFEFVLACTTPTTSSSTAPSRSATKSKSRHIFEEGDAKLTPNSIGATSYQINASFGLCQLAAIRSFG